MRNSKFIKGLLIVVATATLFFSTSISVFGQTLTDGVLGEPLSLSDGLSDFIVENGVLTKYNGIGSEVTIPDSVTCIAANAFSGSNSITTITIPDSVTDIGNRAFQGCENLISVTIGSGVSTVGEAPFMYCLKLQEINVSSSNPNITSLEGVLFNKDKTTLLAFPNGKSGSYTIPDGVKTLANRSFCWSAELTSLKIPDSITTLEYYSVALCEKLTNVEFTGDCLGLTSIGNVFYGSDNLETLSIGKNVSDIDAGQFAYNTKLNNIKVHAENQFFSVEDEILFNKEKSKLILSSKTISGEYHVPISVTEIQPAAFSSCTGLTDIYISSQTTKIGDPNAYHRVFTNCSNLTIHGDDGSAAHQYAQDMGIPFASENGTGIIAVTGIEIEQAVAEATVGENIELRAVISPESATDKSVTWESSNTTVATVDADGWVKCVGAGEAIITARTENGEFSASHTLTVSISDDFVIVDGVLIKYKGGEENVVIPYGVTSIGDSAFQDCTFLRSVTIPDSVTSIGNYAFANCISLSGVNIPDGVISIGNHAFYLCLGLRSVTIPDSVTSIGEQAFSVSMGFLATIDVGNGNTEYSSLDGVLYNKLKTTLIFYPPRKAGSLFAVPDIVTSIGNYAFASCILLTNVTLPNSVISIGEHAFDSCYYLTSVNIPNSITSISSNAFFNCHRLTEMNIPDSVTSIGEQAFMGCSGLTSVIIPDNVTSIGRSAFGSCSGLTSVVIPNSIESIDLFTFNNCSSLTNVTIPDSVTSIGDGAFFNCSSLTNLTLPDSVTSIAYGAFSNCSGLTTIDVGSKNTVYSSIDGILYNKSKTTLICYPAGKTGLLFTVPDSVTSIIDLAFSGCTSLRSLTIPKSITYIGSRAFNNCPNLTIHVVTGSYAHQFALQNNIAYELSDIEVPVGDWGNIVPVSGLTLSESSHTFDGILDEPIYIKATISPYNATKQSMKISTSNKEVAIAKLSKVYNGTGFESLIKVEPVGPGSCNIRIESEGKVAICQITVKRAEFSSEEKTLKRLALSKIVYRDELLAVTGKYLKDIQLPIDSGTMFEVDGEEIKWRDFWDTYIGFYKVIDSKNLTNGMQAIAFEDENKDIVIAFRGTEGLISNDFWEGILYTFSNTKSAQFPGAYDFYSYIKRLYPNRNISLTGHSLGGALAAYVSMLDGNVEALCFNDATGWILWNTHLDYAKQIQNFTGTDQWNFTSYVNMYEDLLIPSFNAYTAHHRLEYRPNIQVTQNAYSTELEQYVLPGYGGYEHSLQSMINYENGEFSLTERISEHSARSPWFINDPYANDVILGESSDEIFTASQFCAANIFTGDGNDTVYGSNWSDVIVASGSGMKKLYGKKGNDTYIIDVSEIDSQIFIDDPSGSDIVYIKGITGINDTNQYPIIDTGSNYVLSLGNGKSITVNKIRTIFSPKINLQDVNNNMRDFSTNQALFKMNFNTTSSQGDSLKSLRIYGNVEVQVYDQGGNLLGTHNNLGNDVQTTNYAYFYPINKETEKYLDIDLINGDYTLKFTSGGNVDFALYDPNTQGSVYYQKKGIDLSDGSILVINSDFLNAVNKFALEKDAVITPLDADEFVNASQVQITQTELRLQAGTAQPISATISPDNALEKGVSWSVIQPSEDTVVAGISTDEDGVTRVIGVAEGTAILRATAVGAPEVYREISITVSQAEAPIVSTGSYIEGSYTDAEAVTISATLPIGFDELYFIKKDGETIKGNSIDITNEGNTTVKVRARNSSTGELSKAAVVTVKIDRSEPEILGLENAKEYYIDRFVTVSDINLEKVTINGTIDFTAEELVRGKWFSEVGEYTLVAKDVSGKETTVSFTLKAIPAVTEITPDSLDSNDIIRNEFEEIKYDLPEERRNALESQITALENKWVISTGLWSIASLESEGEIVTVKVENRLNEYEVELPRLLLAVYDESNKLILFEERAIEREVTDYTFDTIGLTDAKKMKAFLWKDTPSLMPLAKNRVYEVVPVDEGEENSLPGNPGTPETLVNPDGSYTTWGSDPAFANKPMTIIVYKGTELTSENVEYVDQVLANSEGVYSFNNYFPKEGATQLTGRFKVMVGGESLSTPLLAGIIQSSDSSISISLDKVTTTLRVGESEQLLATVLPTDAENKNVIWSVTSGEGVVAVDDGLITALSAGTAIVRATSAEDSTQYDECAVTVIVDRNLSATPLVQIGAMPDDNESVGLVVGLKDIRDAQGNPVLDAKLANYQIEVLCDTNQVKVFDVVDIAQGGQQGSNNLERLFVVPLVLTGNTNEKANVVIRFVSLKDSNSNPITTPEITLTFQRGKVLNEALEKPVGIVDAVAGLQYLAKLADAGLEQGKVNVVNMASIRGPEEGELALKPSIKNIISLMQYLVGMRDPYFNLKPNSLKAIDSATLEGITRPVRGESPATAVAETDQYTNHGSILNSLQE